MKQQDGGRALFADSRSSAWRGFIFQPDVPSKNFSILILLISELIIAGRIFLLEWTGCFPLFQIGNFQSKEVLPERSVDSYKYGIRFEPKTI